MFFFDVAKICCEIEMLKILKLFSIMYKLTKYADKVGEFKKDIYGCGW